MPGLEAKGLLITGAGEVDIVEVLWGEGALLPSELVRKGFEPADPVDEALGRVINGLLLLS